MLKIYIKIRNLSESHPSRQFSPMVFSPPQISKIRVKEEVRIQKCLEDDEDNSTKNKNLTCEMRTKIY